MPFPTITTCIVCDGVRQDILGKYTLVGFYGVTPNVLISVGDFALPVSMVCFFCGTAGGGRFHVELRVTGPSGRLVPCDSAYVDGVLDPNMAVTYVTILF